MLCALIFLFSCEKPVFNNQQEDTGVNGNLLIRVAGFKVVPFGETRGTTAISDYCQRLNFAVYQDGKKVKAVNQVTTDSQFGEANMTLEPGTYQLLVVAHSANGNPSMATPEKIAFTNSDGYTDTFYAYTNIEVDESQKELDITLERATAMFRLITKDKVPENVDRIRFYYTGGSGALNATNGLGCVNSQQVTFFDIADDMKGLPLCMEIYTFPKAEKGKLKVTVTAYSKNTDILYEKELEDVPVEVNKITEYEGYLFGKGGDNGEEENTHGKNERSISVTLNSEWKETIKGTY